MWTFIIGLYDRLDFYPQSVSKKIWANTVFEHIIDYKNQYLSKEWNKIDHKIEALNLGFRRAIETGGWRDA